MIPVSENPAAVDPKRTLTQKQKDALSSIAFFKHQRVDGGLWRIGDKAYSTSTIAALCKHALVLRRGRGLALTTAGQIAAEKLKETPHGSA